MNIKEQLLVEMSRSNIDYIAAYIGNNKLKFRTLVKLLHEEKSPVPERASWAISAITDKYPELGLPYLKTFVEKLPQYPHTGIQRNILRYMAKTEIPEALSGTLYDYCYTVVLSPSFPIAVRANALETMYNIAKNEPDLLQEIKTVIHEILPEGTAGIQSKSKNLLKHIR